MTIECEIAQENFLRNGGVLAKAVGKLRQDQGAFPEWREYPKMIRISRGIQPVERSTEDIKGRTLTWTENKEVFDEIVVNSEEEEERVLAGGKTSAALEQERQDLILRARSFGIKVDPTWTAVRLRRELGEKLDEPQPEDRMGALEQELAALRKMAEMQAEIEALRSQLSARPEDADDLRTQLIALGVTPDKRWGVTRLREELDKATTPDRAA